ncbi:hypothetical protein NUW54_g2991 [Trametes sanguinea]|uniref:Uncharacterized protein n=1 Tax=Trametes sanguinea TaxID=158606 RepID=A0ACC1Q285_9APHY|nr:hypothetical protein NUW54_g2991 [Trametes sanguinea]
MMMMFANAFFLWNDKITCTLDVLMHLLRSIFSQRQLDLFLWLLCVNDVDKVPSVRHMLKLNAILQRACGINSIAYKGALGHTYYVNALNQIIAQEMANSHMQPYLHFYPKDTRGMNISEARQVAQWLNWSFVLDVVEGHDMPGNSWTFTDPVIGNAWRQRVKGHCVVSFPLWMYCDDTSGNLSKKWNEHNSMLMTPAGLHAFMIHFLMTSNLAPPLEMLDGIVEQLRQVQADGIWAWDAVLNEPILVLPFILALLGDNPMQSEFACHIGMQAKFFCHNCWFQTQSEGAVRRSALFPLEVT